jgi:hypothetical protein
MATYVESESTISLMPLKDTQEFHGGVQSFEAMVPYLIDILVHELCHIAQGKYLIDQKNAPNLTTYTGRLGNIATEGHANMMTWLIMGSVELGRPKSLNHFRSIYEPANTYAGIFGRSDDAYGASVPFSSVLVSLYNRVLAKNKTEFDRQQFHQAFSEVVFELYEQLSPSDNFQKWGSQILANLLQKGLIDENDLKFGQLELLKRGLDLNSLQHEGYTNAILINGVPADRTPEAWKTISENGFYSINPTVEVQSSGMNQTKKIEWGALLGGNSILK